jgi:hypothetical protein
MRRGTPSAMRWATTPGAAELSRGSWRTSRHAAAAAAAAHLGGGRVPRAAAGIEWRCMWRVSRPETLALARGARV